MKNITVTIDPATPLGRALNTAAAVTQLEPEHLATGILYAAVRNRQAEEAAQQPTTPTPPTKK